MLYFIYQFPWGCIFGLLLAALIGGVMFLLIQLGKWMERRWPPSP